MQLLGLISAPVVLGGGEGNESLKDKLNVL